MSLLLVGCPVILPPNDDVVASWTHRSHLIICNGAYDEWLGPGLDIAETCLIGGNGTNIGVAASWNRIFDFAVEKQFTYVALLSQGVVLKGGTAQLEQLVEEYADWRGLLTDFGWHLTILSVELWEQVGRFDEDFGPAYFEDADFVRRLYVAGLHSAANPMPKIGRDLLDGTETFAAAIGLIPKGTYGRNAALYEQKWGGPPFEEKYTKPYDPWSLDPRFNSSSDHVEYLARLKGN